MKCTHTDPDLALLRHDGDGLEGLTMDLMPLAPHTRKLRPHVVDTVGPFLLTHHARVRMAQRGLGVDAVLAAIDWGHVHTDPNGVVYSLSRAALARAALAGVDVARYAGVVTVTSGRRVITAYRKCLPATLGRDRERQRARAAGRGDAE